MCISIDNLIIKWVKYEKFGCVGVKVIKKMLLYKSEKMESNCQSGMKGLALRLIKTNKMNINTHQTNGIIIPDINRFLTKKYKCIKTYPTVIN